jgi:hypothetical protein|tara:strand:+ start:265 stop:759 length:495 start_codon:yes stop_codon:yes gene_type:complete
MSINFGDGITHPLIAAVDGDGKILTSIERIQHLFKNGYQIEALTAQMQLVEALCLHYLVARRNIDNQEFDQDIAKLMQKRQLTMGRVKNLLIRNNAFHDPALEPVLEEYVEMRNELSHKLFSRILVVDLERCFALGMQLTISIQNYMQRVIEKYKKVQDKTHIR